MPMRLLFGTFLTGNPNLVFFVREKNRKKKGKMLKNLLCLEQKPRRRIKLILFTYILLILYLS